MSPWKFVCYCRELIWFHKSTLRNSLQVWKHSGCYQRNMQELERVPYNGGGYTNFIKHVWIFPHKLTGIFLSTLDHGFITSKRIFKSILCFIGYTTIFLRILEIYFIFYISITQCLPGAACTRHYNPSTTGKKWCVHFAIGCTIIS